MKQVLTKNPFGAPPSVFFRDVNLRGIKPLLHNAERYIAVENIVRKGEIACNKQFHLLSQCFLPYMALIFRPARVAQW